jgi:hypothetical protein
VEPLLRWELYQLVKDSRFSLKRNSISGLRGVRDDEVNGFGDTKAEDIADSSRKEELKWRQNMSDPSQRTYERMRDNLKDIV